MTQTATAHKIEDIAALYGVAVEDVAIRIGSSTHLYINQRTLCGQDDFNKFPMFAGIKIPTHEDTFGYWGAPCKVCLKALTKKAAK